MSEELKELDEIVYPYVRCRFCKELLYDGQKQDGGVDDMAYGICSDCWKELNKLFIGLKTNPIEIAEAMKRARVKQPDPRDGCKDCVQENTCDLFFKNYHKIPCVRKAVRRA